jgi:hypothetical protein
MNNPEVAVHEFEFYVTNPYRTRHKDKVTFTGDPRDKEWVEKATCSPQNSDSFYAEDAEMQKETAYSLCRSFGRECPVQLPCLIDAMDKKEHWGVRGGLTERERRAFTEKHGRRLLEILATEDYLAQELAIDRSTNPQKYAHLETVEPIRRSFLPGVEFGSTEQQAS